MKLHKWKDIKAERFSAKEIEELGTQAIEELVESDLRALREAAGLTQEEMAARVKIAQSQISRVETRGDTRVSILKRYVEALGGELNIVATVRGKTVRLPL
jgi:predicted transcriptional regulator